MNCFPGGLGWDNLSLVFSFSITWGHSCSKDKRHSFPLAKLNFLLSLQALERLIISYPWVSWPFFRGGRPRHIRALFSPLNEISRRKIHSQHTWPPTELVLLKAAKMENASRLKVHYLCWHQLVSCSFTCKYLDKWTQLTQDGHHSSGQNGDLLKMPKIIYLCTQMEKVGFRTRFNGRLTSNST